MKIYVGYIGQYTEINYSNLVYEIEAFAGLPLASILGRGYDIEPLKHNKYHKMMTLL